MAVVRRERTLHLARWMASVRTPERTPRDSDVSRLSASPTASGRCFFLYRYPMENPVKTIYDERYVRLIERLKQRRQELGLRQEQVARKFHRSRTWVSKVEQRERRLDVVELQDLCDFYGLPLTEVAATLDEEKRQ